MEWYWEDRLWEDIKPSDLLEGELYFLEKKYWETNYKHDGRIFWGMTYQRTYLMHNKLENEGKGPHLLIELIKECDKVRQDIEEKINYS